MHKYLAQAAVVLAAVISFSSTAMAACPAVTIPELQEIFKGRPNVPTFLSAKPVGDGFLFEVLVESQGRKGVIYIDCGRKYLIQGAIVDTKNFSRVVMHEEILPKQLTNIDVKTIPDHAFIMGNPKAVRKLYVFTDPDCPYCRQIHPVLHELVKKHPDIAVHVMLMPIPSLHPAAYDKSRAVLMSKSMKVLDDAFSGKPVTLLKDDKGKKEIDAITSYANKAGINGTPMMFDQTGKIVSGRDVELIAKNIAGGK